MGDYTDKASHVGFPALIGDAPKVMILGSMPGQASLKQFQYYAHPRNAFWPIMGELYDAGFDVEYTLRIERLLARHIAVWDVVQQCVRPGSLDSAIQRSTVVTNDFSACLKAHPSISTLLFNGGAAFTLFKRHALPTLLPDHNVTCVQLPSTSPAHARISFQEKLMLWRSELVRALS